MIAEVHDPFPPRLRPRNKQQPCHTEIARRSVLAFNNNRELVLALLKDRNVCRRESEGSWFFEVVRETTSRRAHVKRSLHDRRRQFQDFAFTENSDDERVSGFEGGDAVVNLFVVFIAGEAAE
jgi:hypothetical protein